MKNKTLTFISLILTVMTVAMSFISLKIKLAEISALEESEITTESVETTENTEAVEESAASE